MTPPPEMLLAAVPAHEPPIGDAVEDIFRRAEAVRRRRVRVLSAAAAAAAVGVATIGYALTTLLLPDTPRHSPAAVAGTAAADPVLDLVRPAVHASGLRLVAREPARGDGWRRYRVLTSNGGPRGIVEIATYAAPTGLCFPVRRHPGACARPERAPGGVEYVRYADDRDVDRQVNEVIARRLTDGRVIVVQATGERGTGSAPAGRPPLSASTSARIATDPRIAAGFGAGERCNAPDHACPVLTVPVRPAGE